MQLKIKINTNDLNKADALVKKMLSALDIIELALITECDLNG